MIEIYAADYAALNSIPAPCEVIPMEIGYQGENGTRCVVFDLSPFISEIGEGTASVIVQRHGETIPYVATNTETVNQTLIWTLTDVDTSIAGYGYAQLRYTVTDGNVRTAVYKTVVYESLGAAGPTPNPMQDLIDEVQAFAEAAEAAATTATTAASSAGDSATAASASALSAAGSAQTAQAAATTLAITETASGDIVTIQDGANNLPVVDLTAQIVAVQEGSGDPSPTNVRNILGWTGVNVTRTGAESTDSQVYSVNWTTEAGDVFGGTIDVTTGTLTVTYESVDMASLSWTYQEVYNNPFFSAGLQRRKFGTNLINAICEIYATMGVTMTLAQFGQNADNLVMNLNGGSASIKVRDNAYNDVASFIAAVSGKKIVFELATPLTYQLTPTEITTFLGVNNFWADTGAIDLTYRADTKTYIDNAIASLQTEARVEGNDDTT